MAPHRAPVDGGFDMTQPNLRWVAPAALAFTLAACAPALPFGSRNLPTERVTLPSGELCAYAGDGATLAFDGDRLSWTCEVAPSGPRGLFGAPVVVGETNVSWRLGTTARRADGAGFELASVESVDARVARVTLAGGESCAFAGEGATLAFDGQRVNYTCDGDLVLIGPLTADARGLLARSATLDRDGEAFVVRQQRTVRVREVRLAGIGDTVTAVDDEDAEEKAEVAHAPLLGTTWTLQRIRFADGSERVPEDPTRFTLTLAADGSAALQVDCNRAAGRFDLDDARLSFGPLAATRAYCGPDSLDETYLEQIAIVVGYRFEDGALLLTTSMDVALLVFAPLN